MIIYEQKQKFAASHFGTAKTVRVTENGYNLKTKKYEQPAGFIKAEHFMDAIDVIRTYEGDFAKMEKANVFISDETIEQKISD